MVTLCWALNWLLGNEKLLKQYQRETPLYQEITAYLYLLLLEGMHKETWMVKVDSRAVWGICSPWLKVALVPFPPSAAPCSTLTV